MTTEETSVASTTSKTVRGFHLELTDEERAGLRKSAEADMKKLGFMTVDELMAYYDSKRGY